MATCGELLVRLLEAYGVELVFGIPGVHTVELYRGLPKTRIRHVTPRHEQGAGFMADGYARATGKPGVCFIITGPGMTNILTAMGQAYGDSVPMLVISSVNRREQLGMGDGRLHELPNQRDMVAGAAAFSHTLMDSSQLPQVLARAFAIFASARPRPVHIEIPIDVIAEPVDAAIMTARPLPSPPAAAPEAARRAATWLRAARKPLLILGGGAVDGAAEALALAEHLDAPVVHTVNAKGILPPCHHLRAGENMAFAPVRDAIAAADVVLAVGSEFGETEMYPDPVPLTFPDRFIRIDIDPEQLVRGFPVGLPITADARLALSEINRELGVAGRTAARPDSPGARRAAEVRAATTRCWGPAVAVHRSIAEIIQKALPDAIFVGDSAEPVYALNLCLETSRPRSYFNSSTGYGTLGYGLPAGIGAKLSAPRPARGGAGGRWRIPIHYRRARRCSRGQGWADRAAVEQRRLWRDQDLHGRASDCAHRRRQLHTRLPCHRQGLWLSCAASRQLRPTGPGARGGQQAKPADRDRNPRRRTVSEELN